MVPESGVFKIHEVEETGSTNDDAKALANTGAPAFTVVWAHRQTAGRGSHQRRWTSIDGNVLWSVILRPDASWPVFTDVVYVNALATLTAIQQSTSVNANLELKWPNDVLLGEQKIAGTLIECGGSWQDGRPSWIVIGTGINVVSAPEADASMLYPPTSLRAHGFEVTREALIGRLHEQLLIELAEWRQGGFRTVRERYLAHAFRLGQEIRVGTSANKSEYQTGVFLGIDETGALLLDVGDLAPQRILSGDVLVRQPDGP